MDHGKYKNKYRIPSARHQHWDYRWAAAYFITICTHHRLHYFGDVVDKRMVLSPLGVLADVFWYEIKNHAQHIELGEFVVMPNHMHGILILTGVENVETRHALSPPNAPNVSNVETRHALSLPNEPNVETRHALSLPTTPPKTLGQQRFQNQGKNSISSIIGGYKSAVTKHAHRLGFDFAWQPRFHDHIIRDEPSFDRISQYIIDNAENWDMDKFYG